MRNFHSRAGWHTVQLLHAFHVRLYFTFVPLRRRFFGFFRACPLSPFFWFGRGFGFGEFPATTSATTPAMTSAMAFAPFPILFFRRFTNHEFTNHPFSCLRTAAI